MKKRLSPNLEVVAEYLSTLPHPWSEWTATAVDSTLLREALTVAREVARAAGRIGKVVDSNAMFTWDDQSQERGRTLLAC